MPVETDIVIIGGGAAGLTAAIAAQNAGLTSVVLERQAAIGDSAGESMHPGIAPIVGQLGLLPDFERAATGRFPGILVRDGCRGERFEPFGEAGGAPWLGYHTPRRRLARLLCRRARELGSTIAFGCKVTDMDVAGKATVVVTAGSQTVRAKWLLDASGPAGFAVRRDRTGYRRASPPGTVAYSYDRQPRFQDRQNRPGLPASCTPVLQIEPWGWTWTAPLGNGVTASVALYRNARAKAEHKSGPPGRVRYADGTWVVANRPSQRGVFRIGDAALRFDPSSGKGVLRAMMTAMMAVHLVGAIGQRSVTGPDAVAFYNGWIHRWFRHDAEALSRALPV